MQILVNHDNTIHGSDDLTETIENAVHDGLDRFGDRLTRVDVYLSKADEHGHHHGPGIQCKLDAHLSGLQPVVADATGDTADHACHAAARKLRQRIEHAAAKHDHA